MTADTITGPTLIPPEPDAPRPGSRAARMAQPRSTDVLREMCAEYGVCPRPLSFRRTDLTTGQTEVIDLPCGATREDRCPVCAARNRRLRQAQIREGWHRDSEPLPGPKPATDEQRALVAGRAHLEFERDAAARSADWGRVDELESSIREIEEAITAEGLRGSMSPPHDRPDQPDHDNGEPAARRKRSTRRRQDAPELPRRPVARRTVGKTYTAPDGTAWRPSMWLTLTLDTYGRVREDGTPVNPATYDYRRAAWDAVHFPRLLDRYWQNLRRAEGWNIQYAGCVEPQRRLAPHAHFAIRGTVPRVVLRQVAAATYHQVWWPRTDVQVYDLDKPPVWDDDTEAWVDPDTRARLTSWDAALDELDDDPDTEPAHVVRFGPQVHAEGVNPATEHANKTIRYITKYVTKTAAACHEVSSGRQLAHLERLWQELRVTPCSPRCANWLLYGIAPKGAHAKLKPGGCKGRVHARATLGIGGRRILISRDWSGKTLADHKADTRDWVRALLGTVDNPADDQADAAEPDRSATDSGDDPPGRYAWELARPDDPDIPPVQHRLLRSVAERARWRAQLNTARDNAAQAAQAGEADRHSRSATHDPGTRSETGESNP
jgi:hypothetical protein